MSETNDKTLWGLDPNLLYRWSPTAFVVPPKAFDEEWEKAGKEADEADPPITGDAKLKKQRDAVKDWWGIPWDIKEGAPIIKCAPLSEQASQKLQAARAFYERMLSIAKDRLDKKIAAIKVKEGLSEDEKQDQIDALTFAAEEENVKRGISAYSPELRSEIISDCIRGWENMKAPYTGKWEEDARALLMTWKDELFRDILNGSAFLREEVESFTSQPGSGAA